MTIEHGKRHILIRLAKPVRALSSSPVGCGLLVTDTILNLRTTSSAAMKSSPEELVSRFLKSRRLAAPAAGSRENRTVALLTAAHFEYAQFVLRTEMGIKVFVTVTAGVSNALNISERTPTEHTGAARPAAGTINIVVLANAGLTDDCLVSSVISATEAKSAALYDLGIKSVVTGSQATGTGTDAVVVVSGEGVEMKYAGAHTLYGQLLGEAVYRGVTDALSKRRGAHPPLEQLCRSFEDTEESYVWRRH